MQLSPAPCGNHEECESAPNLEDMITAVQDSAVGCGMLAAYTRVLNAEPCRLLNEIRQIFALFSLNMYSYLPQIDPIS